jgi:hypothetical protein
MGAPTEPAVEENPPDKVLNSLNHRKSLLQITPWLPLSFDILAKSPYSPSSIPRILVIHSTV